METRSGASPETSAALAALLRERRRLYLEWSLFLIATAGLFRIASLLEGAGPDAVALFLLLGAAYSVFTVGFVQRFGEVMSHTCPRCHETLHSLPLRPISRRCQSCGLAAGGEAAPSSNRPPA